MNKNVFLNWYHNFTKRYEFPISNGTGPITTAQPSLNVDTPLPTGNGQNQNTNKRRNSQTESPTSPLQKNNF